MNEGNARDQLEDILNDPEYLAYQQEAGFFARLWEKAIDAIMKALEALFPSVEPTARASSIILIAIIAILIIALVVIATVLVSKRIKRRKLSERKPLQSMNELEWSYKRHLKEADACSEKGDHRQATRHMFLALLLYFHEKEWLKAMVWKTNWDYYDELRKVNQEWAERFYRLAVVFDEVAYGEHDVDAEEFALFRNEAIKLIETRNHEN
ncbi:DUF4129 domain-containing protein [Rossellomorea marisflavi]|uniref:DUF4129 domain-containing protein n=1 Tax=Rossellomorea marisflavi TaxID=189381 RepID=UPI0035128438